jgi:hypothetical protein
LSHIIIYYLIGALAIGKGDDDVAKLEQAKAVKQMAKGGYDADAIPMRYKLFGAEYDGAVEDENHEHLQVATEVEDLMSYSFFPFGLGKHMCLGRRLVCFWLEIFFVPAKKKHSMSLLSLSQQACC